MALFAVFLLEVFVFNSASFSIEPKSRRYLISDTEIIAGLLETGPENYTFQGESSILINNPPEYTRSVTLVQTRNKTGLFNTYTVDLLLTDESSSYAEQKADSRRLGGYGDKYNFALHPYGKINTVKFNIHGNNDYIYVSEIVCSNTKPFEIMPERIIILSLAATFVILSKSFKWWDVYYDKNSKLQKRIIWAVILLTAATTFIGYDSTFFELYTYPPEDGGIYSQAYLMQFDAMEKNLTYLDYPVDQSLMNLDNPYDFSERSMFGANYLWDYSYYNGHYYCYFGKAPVLLLYYPLYWLTGKLPSYSLAISMFATFAVAAVGMAVYSAVTYFVKKPRLLVLLSLIPTAVCASYLPLNMTDPSVYLIACVCATGLVALALYGAFTALKSDNLLTRAIYLALSGTATSFSVGARPVTTLALIVLIPLFLSVLLDKKRPLKHRLSDAASFLIPVLIGAVLIMRNNYNTFGSVFEFGSSYQLTTNDIRLTFTSLTLLPAALWYQFIEPFAPYEFFPFLQASTTSIYKYQNFKNMVPNVGILNIPFILLGYIYAFEIFKLKRDNLHSVTNFAYKAFYVLCFALPVPMAFLIFTAGGASLRYTADSLVPVVIGCSVVFANILGSNATRFRKNLYIIAAIISIFIIVMIPFNFNISTMFIACPEFYEKAEEMLLFWR